MNAARLETTDPIAASLAQTAAVTEAIKRQNGARMANPGQPALMGLDWGTSALRGPLVAADSSVIETIHQPWGIPTLPSGGFAEVYRRIAGAWLSRRPPLAESHLAARRRELCRMVSQRDTGLLTSLSIIGANDVESPSLAGSVCYGLVVGKVERISS